MSTTLIEDYLIGCGGSIQNYHYGLCHYRPGQAFFMALTESDKEKVRGTIYDPFHKIGTKWIEPVIEFLLS